MLLVDRARLRTLAAPETTVLTAGLRVLNANVGKSRHVVFSTRPETLTNNFCTVVDLDFCSNARHVALAEIYASNDGQRVFVRDFVAAWNKVMNVDRFDLA